MNTPVEKVKNLKDSRLSNQSMNNRRISRIAGSNLNSNKNSMINNEINNMMAENIKKKSDK